MNKCKYCIALFLFVAALSIEGQEHPTELTLSLDEVIRLANDSSLQAFIAQNTYMAEFWDYKNYRAQKRPFLNFTTTPVDFSRRYSQQYNFQDSSYYYVEQQTLGASGNVSLNQTIMKTGGYLYVDTDLGYLNNLNQPGVSQYYSTPVRIGFSQQLFGYNQYKWLSKIAPVEFEAAKKQLIQDMENVSLTAVNYFFSLSKAQINLEIAKTTLANADTLYNIGVKRFNLATISKEDLYTLKLALVNATNDFERARTNLRRAQMRMNSLLRFDNSVRISLTLPNDLPELKVDPLVCLELALKNNPEVFDWEVQRISTARSVERAKKNSKMKANLNTSFGLNQQGSTLPSAYRNPSDQEVVRVGVSIPILDWGLSESEYKLAQMQQEVVHASIEQAEADFRETILITADEFNLQRQFVKGSEEADTIAKVAYDITRRRYLSGQADIIKLSTYQRSSISARRAYIESLESYWKYYYTIRKLTLHDFETGKDLEQEFEEVFGR